MKRHGFSLIEVNIAILVIAGGMLSLFALFPAGMRLSAAALSDTRQVFFADDFFSFFDEGVRQIDSLDQWQNIEKFLDAGCDGLEAGFDDRVQIDSGFWTGNSEVQKDWKVGSSDFSNGTSGSQTGTVFLRFVHGKVVGRFKNNSGSAGDALDAEFLIRVASEYNAYDQLVWRVSLIVSDDGLGGWYYDNSVFFRDFRYTDLP